VGHLNELWAKYRDRGLVVLAVTNEGRSLVDGFVEKTGATHPIVIEKSDSAAAFGIEGFPTTYLVDPDGRIASIDDAQESRIEALLAKVRLAPALPGKLASLKKNFDKKDYAAAAKALEGLLKGTSLGEEDRKAAEVAAKWIVDTGAAMLANADAADKAGDPFEAAQTLRRVKESFKGLEAATKAEEALKALSADKAKDREIVAGDAWEKTLARAKTLKPEQAAAMCRAFAKKYEGTKAGAKAEKAAVGFEAEAKGR
jgi:hypothetical protein